MNVIISPPITPNKFWGFKKRNSQDNDTTLSCPYEENYIIPYTKRFSGINWRNKFHLGYTRKFLGN